MGPKRRDNKGRLLQLGEWQDESGRYRYKYTDVLGKRKTIYSWRLTEADKVPDGRRNDLSLREKERKVQSLHLQGINGSELTVLELVERYLSLKAGVKHNTMANYKFVVNALKKEEFAYLHVDDDLILKNPFSFELGSLIVNDSKTRQAISQKDEERFLNYVKEDLHYYQYYDAFFLLFKTGMRISEFCGLTVWDLDFEHEVINIDHQLQRTRDMKYVIESTKTTSGTRQIPMTEEVKEVCLHIVKNRKKPKREPMVGGHGGFLYLDKNGKPRVALHWEKYMQFARDKYNREHPLQLPPITPHICRHTYCSNMARIEINPKTLQYLMGHSDISVTLNVYTHLGLDDARVELQRLQEIKSEVRRENMG